MTKQTLILLPGLLSDKALWRHQTHHLGDIAHIKVIELTDNSSESMISTVLKHAPKQFALAGHSMGGWLALEVVKAVPERIIKLCLLNTTARSDSSEKYLNRKKMIEAVNQGQFTDVANNITNHFVYHQVVKKDILDMFLRVGQQTFINQQTAMMNREECISTLPNILCPTLIIHAQQDKNFSKEMHEELTYHIPHAQLAIVEDSGHMSPMEMPQAITTLMRYWLTYF